MYLNISLTVPLQGTEHQTRGFSSICWRWICALPCRQDLAIPAMPHLLVTSLVIDKKENPIQMVTKLTSLLYVAIPCYYNQLQAVMRRTSQGNSLPDSLCGFCSLDILTQPIWHLHRPHKYFFGYSDTQVTKTKHNHLLFGHMHNDLYQFLQQSCTCYLADAALWINQIIGSTNEGLKWSTPFCDMKS